MEQPESYWMCARRTRTEMPVFATQIPTFPATAGAGAGSYNLSWEEVAFAKDAGGHLGGCIWPPRSYSCSFCRREFPSAQALGGHMNVHRRDRARLRQSSCSSPNVEKLEDRHDQNLNPISIDMGANQFLQAHNNLFFDTTTTNPNPKSDVSALTIQEMNLSEHTKIRCTTISSSCFQEKMEPFLSPSGSTEHLIVPLQLFMVPEPKLEKDHESVPQEARLRRRRDLSEDICDSVNCSKRRRTDTVSYNITSSCDQEKIESQDHQVHDLNHFSLDLELRLGTPKSE